MMRWRRTTACERAAQWISLGLDGELRARDRAALDRHLERVRRAAARSARRSAAHAAAARGAARSSSTATPVGRRPASRGRAASGRAAAVASSRSPPPRRLAVVVTLLRRASRSVRQLALGFRSVARAGQRYAQAEQQPVEPHGLRRCDFTSRPRSPARAPIDCRASRRKPRTPARRSRPSHLATAQRPPRRLMATNGQERERRQADRDQGRRRRRRLPDATARDLLGAAHRRGPTAASSSRRCSSTSATTACAPSRWTRPTASPAAPT